MALPENTRCLGCGCTLHESAESWCSKCGRGFDPACPDTFAVGTRAAGWGHVFVAMVALGGLIAYARFSNGSLASLIFLGSLANCVELYIVVRSMLELRKPAGLQPHRVSWALAMFFSLLTNLASCTIVGLVMYGLSHFSLGPLLS